MNCSVYSGKQKRYLFAMNRDIKVYHFLWCYDEFVQCIAATKMVDMKYINKFSSGKIVMKSFRCRIFHTTTKENVHDKPLAG